MKITKCFPFLDQRTYLHASTLLNSLLSELKYPTQYSFQFKKRTFANNVLIEEREPYASDIAVLIIPGTKKRTICVGQLAIDNEIPRGTLNETYLRDTIKKCDDSCEAVNVDRNELIETIIVMNKMITDQFKPSKNIKWMFTRLDIQDDFKLPCNILLDLERLIPNKICLCQITLNGKQCGKIYFNCVSE